nr:PREDICTED: 28S ribosomal protein S10, mitochondrial [Bemisia tabaci]
MNSVSKQLFSFLNRLPQCTTPATVAGFLRFHNGCPSLAETAVKNETQEPASRGLTSVVDKVDSYEPDKLYKLIELEMRANQKQILNSYVVFLKMAADGLGIEVGKVWGPDKAHHQRYTILRSAFVHKRCRVQYEYRTYHRYMSFLKLTGSTADTFLEYIERNLPEGLGLKVTKVAVEPVPEHLVPGKSEEVEESSS